MLILWFNIKPSNLFAMIKIYNIMTMYIMLLIAFSSCRSNKFSTHAFKDWDLNGDGAVDYDEFSHILNNKKLMKHWGLNGDSAISEDELFKLFFALWDSNNNGIIENNEWNYGTRNYFAIYLVSDHGTFIEWDLNGDLKLDEKEFRMALTRADFFGGWNFRDDNKVDAAEFTERLFTFWDLNKNGSIEESEYERVKRIFITYEEE
jgi:Ca2+-binding EF-hand superfamily protein